MKKIRIAAIILSVITVIGLVAVIAIHYSSDKTATPTDVPVQSEIDENIIKMNGEISPERINGVYITDGTDGSFVAADSNFIGSLAVLEQSIFDEVYINVPDISEDRGERISYALGMVKAISKKAFICLPLTDEGVAEALTFTDADGFIFTVIGIASAEDINSRLASVKAAGDFITVLSVESAFSLDGIEAANLDRVCYTLVREGDAEALPDAAEGVETMCCLDITAANGRVITSDVPLRNLYALRENSSVTAIGFDGLQSTRKNLYNCFGAVKTYITSGIAPEIAFREIAVTGYEGGTVTVSGYTAQINIHGSYLFPFFVEGKNIGSSANGNISTVVDLKPGENRFSLSQTGNEAEYSVRSDCSKDIVSYILPATDIYVLPEESFKVTVIAHCNAEIYVKVGREEIKAQKEYGAGGFTSFTARITAPKTEEEIKTIGSLTVLAYFGESAKQYKGAKICLAGTEPSASESTTGTTLNVGNYNPVPPSESYITVLPGSNTQNYTGNLMCVIKEPYADVKPISTGDKYSPSCSPLAGGTMDYVVAESSSYNSDEGTEEYYYDLASGVRVKKEMADLVSAAGMKDNKITVQSVVSGLGKLQITLDTDWRVPYNIDYPGQNYYYSYKGYYNVTSFNADTVRITFYHTVSAAGEIDVSGCDVLESAVWSSSPSDNTSILTLRLKNAGEYYGCSLEYDTAGNMVITVNRKPMEKNGYVVVLDAGHGGAEPGAVGLDSTVQERYLNLAFAYQVKAELEKKGVTVYMTRTGNDKQKDTLSLEERKEFTRKVKPDLYISIHCNGSYNPASIGTSTYYYEPFSYNLANNIYTELLSVHKNHLYAGNPGVYSELADNVQYYPFSVTRIEDCPSTLIEVGYLTNDNECAMLAQPENQERFGKAIADGIYKTLTQ